jgi:hypothetical protein
VIYSVQRFTAEEWAPYAEDAHKALFGVTRPNTLNSHHFILAVYGDGVLGGYITCLEIDSETAYIQYGGVFPNFERSIHVVPGYGKMIAWLRENYSRANTKVENVNLPMLKMAMQVGFLVTGTHFHEGRLFVDLTNNLKDRG